MVEWLSKQRVQRNSGSFLAVLHVANPAARRVNLRRIYFEQGALGVPGGLRVCDLTGETSRAASTFHSAGLLA